MQLADAWQYSSTASVPDIIGNVDMNHFYVDFPCRPIARSEEEGIEGAGTEGGSPEAAGTEGESPEAAGTEGGSPEAAGTEGGSPEAAGTGGRRQQNAISISWTSRKPLTQTAGKT